MIGALVRILIVEDEAMIMMTIEMILCDDGHEVLKAKNGQMAYNCLKEISNIDLLLTDIRIPPPNGIEVANLAVKINPGTAILFMSGHILDVTNILSCPCRLLSKPFSYDTIGAEVRQSRQEHLDWMRDGHPNLRGAESIVLGKTDAAGFD